MNSLEKLTEILTPEEAKAARMGYALGYSHADNGHSEALPWPEAPEWKLIEDLGLCDPKTW